MNRHRADNGYSRIQKPTNLNDLHINDADSGPVAIAYERPDTSTFKDCWVDVVFQDLETRLVEFLNWPRCTAVVGCMAWLTNGRVLDALAGKEAVSVLVQKEDFLRPDAGVWTKSKVQTKYAALPEFNRFYSTHGYSVCSDPYADAVRCVGITAGSGSAKPRMHHKFLVLCEVVGTIKHDYPGGSLHPWAVWTGSFNATENGTRSFENAVLIHNEDVAAMYFAEWSALLGVSEPLDWASEWVQPEYRIGT